MSDQNTFDDRIQQRPISHLLSENYLRYMEMTVLDRSLPCGLDGQKPGQRRILYVMFSSYNASGPHAKSARIVGKVMGEFHPHGDASIYRTMVRMGQSWSNNIPLVDGQGNFGSLDGDSPAAMRYTEARLHAIAQDIFSDLKYLDPEREEMVPNYDERIKEPSVLPVKIPLLLINGAIGVAAGVATCIPPHNPFEVCTAACALLKDASMTDEAICDIIRGPDFPTGGVITSASDMRTGVRTGRAKFGLRGTYEIIPSERRSRGDTIVITSLPYGVTTSAWMQSAIDEVGDQIADIKDKSTKTAVNVALVLRNGVDAQVVVKTLLARTQLHETYTYNVTAILNNAPVVAGVAHFLRSFCEFRIETIYARIEHQTNKMRDQMVRNLALWIARYDVDTVLSILRSSEDAAESVQRIAQIKFTLADHAEMREILHLYNPDVQWPEVYDVGEKIAQIIAGEKLTLLAKTELNRVMTTIADLRSKIKENESILADEVKLRDIAIEEMEQIMPHLRSERLTHISEDEAEVPCFVVGEDDVPEQSLSVSFSDGFIGAWPEGKASKGDLLPAQSRFTCSSRDQILVFTNKLRVVTLKASVLEFCDPSTNGRFIGNYFSDFSDDERVVCVLPVVKGRDLLFVSRYGSIRRTTYDNMTTILSRGILYYPDTELCVAILSVADKDTVLIGTNDGRALRFEISDALRCTGSKTSLGVCGIKMIDDSHVVSASVLGGAHLETQEDRAAWVAGTMPEPRQSDADKSASPILTVLEDGNAKIFMSHDIPPQSRGGKGLMCIRERKSVSYIGTIPQSGVFINGQHVDVSNVKIERSRTAKSATRVMEGQ